MRRRFRKLFGKSDARARSNENEQLKKIHNDATSVKGKPKKESKTGEKIKQIEKLKA